MLYPTELRGLFRSAFLAHSMPQGVKPILNLALLSPQGNHGEFIRRPDYGAPAMMPLSQVREVA
jgi:hypothetical protein